MTNTKNDPIDLYENIPVDWRTYPHWIVWRMDYKDEFRGKPTKLPVSPITGQVCDATDLRNGVTFFDALDCLRRKGNEWALSGMGFILSDESPYTAIDLDPVNPQWPIEEQLSVRADQEKIFQQFDSYTELSPSKGGVHIIVKGKVPNRRMKGVEVYSRNRFITVTGDVISAKRTTEDRQEKLDGLVHEIDALTGKPVREDLTFADRAEKHTDEEIFRTCSMDLKNKDLFAQLWAGDWHSPSNTDGTQRFGSQSEADFALIDIIGFASGNRQQTHRLFLASGLGKRPKAQRKEYVSWMLDRINDNKPPVIDLSAIYNEAEAYKHVNLKKPAPVTVAPLAALQSVYTFPPGLVGDLASFILYATPRCVPQFALIASLAFVAGICGRSHNVSDTGLNLYAAAIAPTGTGKESMAGGINAILSDMMDTTRRGANVGLKQFIGPGAHASGPALVKALKDNRSQLSIWGEFSGLLQMMADPRAPSNVVSLRTVLLDLFMKSGAREAYMGIAYSDKEKDVKPIMSPAFSLLCEMTIDGFEKAVNDDVVSMGLLPRFIVFEYDGFRVPHNENTNKILAQPVREHLAALSFCCMTQNITRHTDPLDKNSPEHRHAAIKVELDQAAQQRQRAFNEHIDQLMNGSKQEKLKQLYNRVHLKALKLAAVVAVGINHQTPLITIECLEWAIAIVMEDTRLMLDRFNSGRIGAVVNPRGKDEVKQIAKVAERFLQYTQSPFEKIGDTKQNRNLHADYLVPFNYLSRPAFNWSSFTKDQSASVGVIMKRTLETMEKLEVISRVDTSPGSAFANKHGPKHRGEIYVVLDHAEIARMAELI